MKAQIPVLSAKYRALVTRYLFQCVVSNRQSWLLVQLILYNLSPRADYGRYDCTLTK